jgi:hypothetical protein
MDKRLAQNFTSGEAHPKSGRPAHEMADEIRFTVGTEYRRSSLHDQYGGS